MSDNPFPSIEDDRQDNIAPPPEETQTEDPRELADRYKRQAEREAAGRAEAERRAQEAEERRQAAERERDATRASAGDTQMGAIETALEARTSEKASLRAELRVAKESGDIDREADITERLGRLGYEIAQLETGKGELEARRNQRSQDAARPHQPAQQNQPSAMEADLARRTPKTAAWLREHPEFYSDPRFRTKVESAHGLAVADGLVPDTEEYFAKIEEIAGVTQKPQAQPQQRDRMPSTPPARGAEPSGRRPGDTYITPEMRRAAAMCGITPEEYARSYDALKTGREKDPNWKAWAG